MGPISRALELIASLPEPVILLVLSLGALLENIVPPIPADSFVVVGGLLAARGAVDPVWSFVGIWLANVGGAVAIYGFGHWRGRRFFELGAGRRVLSPGQLERIARFYRNWGVLAIFLARFLPGLRAVVPAFAGVSHLPSWKVVPPILTASAIWYGILLWLGMQAAGRIPVVEAWLAEANRGLLLTATVLVLGLLIWWWRTREPAHDSGGGASDGGGHGAGGGPAGRTGGSDGAGR